MLDFFVLGIIPGTDIQIGSAIMVFFLLLCLFLLI